MGALDGRVAIVTGGGAGIGRGIAGRFAREGARVVIAERDVASGTAAVADLVGGGFEALFVETDVSERAQVDRMVEQAVAHFGTVHVLVNNAWSGSRLERVERTGEEDMRRAFEVGTLAAFWSMQACFPHMDAQRFGRVINLCSLNGVNAHMYSLPYNMAKEALRTLTRTAAREWADRGITCNVVCPAAETEAVARMRLAAPAMFEELDATMPMGRMGDPEEDIAPVAVFLASDGSRFLTGNTLFADGGSHINGSPWTPERPE